MGVLLFKGGVGVGMLKWQTSGSPCVQGEPEGGGRQLPFFVNFGLAIGIIRIGSNRSCCPLLSAFLRASFRAGAAHAGEGRAHAFQDARARLACK
jgi:hypothetical protein